MRCAADADLATLLRIKSARVDPGLARLVRRVAPSLRFAIASPTSYVLCYVDRRDAIYGWAHLQRQTRDGSSVLTLVDFWIRQGYGRRGIGRALHACLVAVAQREGLTMHGVPEQDAIPFYRSMGWTIHEVEDRQTQMAHHGQ